MLYREIIAVCSQIHTKHINTLCGQNVEMLNVKLAVHIVTTGLWMVNFPQVSALHLSRCHHSANRTCNAVMCVAFNANSSMFPFMFIVYHPNYSFVPLLFCVKQPQHKTGQRKKLPTRRALLNSLALWDGEGTGSAMCVELIIESFFGYRVHKLLLLNISTFKTTKQRLVGRIAQSVQWLSTGWTVRESNPGGGEIFRTCPHRTWGPPSLLYKGYRVFPRGK